MLLAGCTTLPNVEKVNYDSPRAESSPPTFAAEKQLTSEASKALIEQMEQQTIPTDLLERHIDAEEAMSGNPLVAGNKVVLLVDGPATYAAMTKVIKNATDHINFETFVFRDDEVGRGFARLLLQKAAEGVQVNLIYDALGSLETGSVFFEHLRHGGILVLRWVHQYGFVELPEE